MLGVTLAGWLVLDQDITPSLWAGVGGAPVGEAALMQTAAAQARSAQCCPAALAKGVALKKLLVSRNKSL